jgi:hypothetical protein
LGAFSVDMVYSLASKFADKGGGPTIPILQRPPLHPSRYKRAHNHTPQMTLQGVIDWVLLF